MRITSRAIFTLALIPLLLFSLSFDPILSLTFLAFLFGGYLIFLGDKHVTYRFESRPQQRYQDIGIGILVTFIFFYILPIILPIFGFSVTEPMQSLYSTTLLFSQYALAGIPWVVFIVWGLLIPIVETVFVVRIYESLTDIFNGHSRWTIETLAAVLAVSSGMALFHIQSKGLGIESTSALFITLLFFALSLAVVIWRKQIFPGIVMHITANIMALQDMIPELLGFLGSQPVLIGAGIVSLLFLLKSGTISNALGRI